VPARRPAAVTRRSLPAGGVAAPPARAQSVGRGPEWRYGRGVTFAREAPDVNPAEQIRRTLAEQRNAGLAFDDAWPAALAEATRGGGDRAACQASSKARPAFRCSASVRRI